jgi:putative transposase
MSDYRRARSGNTYFFTLVTYGRLPILCIDESRKALKDAIIEVRAKRPFETKAWVLLPDHLHAIWVLPEGDSDYSVRWALIKKGFTKKIEGHFETPKPNRSQIRKREGTIWQRRFWEHQIRDDADFNIHCDYIHYNPVKHGLADSPKAWKFSTFHRYVEAGLYPKDWGDTGLEIHLDGGE